MNSKYAVFLDAIKCFLKDEKSEFLKNADVDLKNLYRVSFSYDLMQIVYYSLEKNGVKTTNYVENDDCCGWIHK